MEKPVTLGQSKRCQFILTRGNRAGETCNATGRECNGVTYCKRHMQMEGIEPDPIQLAPVDPPRQPAIEEPQPEMMDYSNEDFNYEDYIEDPSVFDYEEAPAEDLPPPSPVEDKPGAKIGAFLKTVAKKPKVAEAAKQLKQAATVRKQIADVKKVAVQTSSPALHEQAEVLEEYVDYQEQGSEDPEMAMVEAEPPMSEDEVKEIKRIEQNTELLIDAAKGVAVLAEGVLTHNLRSRGLRADGAAEKWCTDIQVQDDLRTTIKEDENVKEVIQKMTPFQRLMLRTTAIFGLTVFNNHKADQLGDKLDRPLPADAIANITRSLPDLPDRG